MAQYCLECHKSWLSRCLVYAEDQGTRSNTARLVRALVLACGTTAAGALATSLLVLVPDVVAAPDHVRSKRKKALSATYKCSYAAPWVHAVLHCCTEAVDFVGLTVVEQATVG